MPALQAHFLLAQLAMQRTTETVQQAINRSIPMFQLGAQGPDLLFYCNPLVKNKVNHKGHRLHRLSGASFFTRQLQTRDTWSAAQTAYLLGVCCHYALDRNCHPTVIAMAPDAVSHQRLESQLDRLIINRYGLVGKRYQVIPVTGLDGQALGAVYGECPLALLSSAIAFRRLNQLFLAKPLIQGAEQLLGAPDKFSSLCLPTGSGHADLLLESFETAIDEAAFLMDQLLDPTTNGRLLRMSMPENFLGVIV